MDLKDFVSETLMQVVSGVVDAQTRVRSVGGAVVPLVRNPPEDIGLYGTTNDGKPVVLIDFDVSIAVQEGTATKGGIGVVAGVFTLGTQGQSNENTQTASRIKFRVPVALPLQHHTTPSSDAA